MESLKRKSVRAYLLLESLITLALLGILTMIILAEVVHARQATMRENQQIEALNVAKMAIDSDLTELSANGAVIKIVENKKNLFITNHGEEILRLELEN